MMLWLRVRRSFLLVVVVADVVFSPSVQTFWYTLDPCEDWRYSSSKCTKHSTTQHHCKR